MALTWKDHSLGMLCDLLERMHDLPDADQDRVWVLIETWARTKASDADKAVMREKIRVTTMSRQMARRVKKNPKAGGLAVAGKAAYAALEPSDLLNRLAWLFDDEWVAESSDEIEDIEDTDFHKRHDHIRNQRVEALRDVMAHRGLAGLLELSKRGKTSSIIGGLAAEAVLSEQELQELVRLAFVTVLAGKEETHSFEKLIYGALRTLVDEEKREAFVTNVAVGLSEMDVARLFVLAPFTRSTWTLVDALGEAAQAEYWSKAVPDQVYSSDVENKEAIERLLKAGRPRAAFSCLRYRSSKLDVEVLCRLLLAVVHGGNDQPGEHILDQYHLEEAFKHLDSDRTLTVDQKASLEFAYIEMLAQSWGSRDNYGIPNLEQYVEAHPELFIQAIVWSYKRKDGATDPAEFQLLPERVEAMAMRGYKLLEAIKRIPGYNNLGELEADRLAKWIATVRKSCTELDRANVADVCIGKLLSCASTGKDGVWPCESVRDVMENIQSESMMKGAHTGVYNSRGVHSCGEGGDQERELAEKYDRWARALQVSHPFVASKLLMVLAKTYNREAGHQDMEATIRRRLR